MFAADFFTTLFFVDWAKLFVPSYSILETIIRGTVTYIVLFMFLRILRRETGTLNITDLLVVVVIADAAQNAMAGEYKSITEGIILVATIMFWDYLMDWLSFRFPAIRRLLRPSPLLLIKDGEIQRRNLRQEMITIDELMSSLREQGIEKISEVDKAFLEGDGKISVIKQGRS